MENKLLTFKCEERVKFSDVDSMGIMWHGNYFKLFEEAREQFGLKYGLDYLRIHHIGFFTPIVESSIKHQAPLAYGDTAIIECYYNFTKAAKIVFTYKIFSKNTKKLCATGKTVQVFLNKNYELHFTNPDYYEQWKLTNFQL